MSQSQLRRRRSYASGNGMTKPPKSGVYIQDSNGLFYYPEEWTGEGTVSGVLVNSYSNSPEILVSLEEFKCNFTEDYTVDMNSVIENYGYEGLQDILVSLYGSKATAAYTASTYKFPCGEYGRLFDYTAAQVVCSYLSELNDVLSDLNSEPVEYNYWMDEVKDQLYAYTVRFDPYDLDFMRDPIVRYNDSSVRPIAYYYFDMN